MLVKMMNVHSAAVTRAILEQLHSNVIDVSSRLPSFTLEEEGKMHCLPHLPVPSLRIDQGVRLLLQNWRADKISEIKEGWSLDETGLMIDLDFLSCFC